MVQAKDLMMTLLFAILTFTAYWLAITKVDLIQQLFGQNRLGYAILCVATMAICGALLGFFADSITSVLGWKIERVEEAEVERIEE